MTTLPDGGRQKDQGFELAACLATHSFARVDQFKCDILETLKFRCQGVYGLGGIGREKEYDEPIFLVHQERDKWEHEHEKQRGNEDVDDHLEIPKQLTPVDQCELTKGLRVEHMASFRACALRTNRRNRSCSVVGSVGKFLAPGYSAGSMRCRSVSPRWAVCARMTYRPADGVPQAAAPALPARPLTADGHTVGRFGRLGVGIEREKPTVHIPHGAAQADSRTHRVQDCLIPFDVLR